VEGGGLSITSAGQKNGVEVVGLGVFHLLVDDKFVPLVDVIHSQHRFVFGRDHDRVGSRVVQSRSRLLKLNLLKSVGDQDRDTQTLQIAVSHDGRTSFSSLTVAASVRSRPE